MIVAALTQFAASDEAVPAAVRGLRADSRGVPRNLGLQPTPDPQAGAAWSVLIPAEPGIAGRWPHVLDEVAQRPALYREPVDLESEWIGEGGKVLYARLYEKSSRDAPSLEDKLIAMLANDVVTRKPSGVRTAKRMRSREPGKVVAV